MQQIKPCFTNISSYVNNTRKPDFNNLLKVLHRERPERPTLFEYFLNGNLYLKLAGQEKYFEDNWLFNLRVNINAFKNAGYDYVTLQGSDFHFTTGRHLGNHKKTISLNDGAVICDRESFENYKWPNPEEFDYSRLEKFADYLPVGMKFVVHDPDGLLETVIALVGYESLCYMLVDDRELVRDIFEAVGSRLVKYFEICSNYDAVGALLASDDWGFSTQTLLSVDDMREFLFPWHKKIVEVIHNNGKPVILHSCGNLSEIMEDIIEDMKYDAKHSFEDKIVPVEKFYEIYGSRIAILGGIDLDYICRSSSEEVYNRSIAMLERASEKGGYALGSGNSIPDYVPHENYLAMISAVNC